MNKLNANSRIKAAQVRNEEEMLNLITRFNKLGKGYVPQFLNNAHWNALSRLKERGRVRWSTQVKGYVDTQLLEVDKRKDQKS